MKRRTLLFVFVLCAAAVMQAQSRWSFKGTVVRMRMTNCVPSSSFKASFQAVPMSGMSCPEYTVVSSNVVYVVVGHHTEEFIPLAENLDFNIRKNEIVIFSNDEKAKSRFMVQQMILRADWEREEQRKELEAQMMERSISYEVRNPPRVVSASCGR